MNVKELFDLSGRIALITGGSRGLGLQMAEALGDLGAKVAISARKQGELDAASSYLTAKGIEVSTIVNDLGDPASSPEDKLTNSVLERFGAIDILINNAGTVWGGAAVDLTPESWRKVMGLNVDACFRVAQAVAKQSMIPRKTGKIINIASIAGLGGPRPDGKVFAASYNTSKGALITLTQALATEWGRRAVISSLVANVASAYFQLRALDLQLELSQNALTARRESLRLTSVLSNHGYTSELDVRQAEQLVYTASEEIPDLERRIQQEENFLSTLLGSNPGSIARGLRLTEQPHSPEIPAGIPSELLERRPDIRQSEQLLIAANAQIGVARAAYYPQIALTGSGGFQSDALARLFAGSAGLWNFAGSLTQPIFTAGKIRSGVRFAEAQQQEALLFYQQTIQQSFRDVSDSLIGYRKNLEFREQQELLTASAKDAARLSNIRYKGGVTSYLEVLTNETNYFTAELNLAQAQANELLALVQLYQALGGGWQQ